MAMILTKAQLKLHKQKLINNLNHQLFMVDCKLQEGVVGIERERLEQRSAELSVRLMSLYGTEKYSLVQ